MQAKNVERPFNNFDRKFSLTFKHFCFSYFTFDLSLDFSEFLSFIHYVRPLLLKQVTF